MRIEIICTGDEVLTGKIVNTNFSYMTQKLEDAGLAVVWGTTVGDDRDRLLEAFHLAGQRADAVIVNGGLGPTIDDLSQEIAAQAAGVDLILHDQWLEKMEGFFTRRGRTMPPNNRKQAMLPSTAEMLDNPIGTACGFAMEIGAARFFFTPGVPRELHRMLEQQIIPRLLAREGGVAPTIHLKRFHIYGLGESHVDQLLTGLEDLVPDGSLKLGFRAHYPQIEVKLTLRGTDMNDVQRKLAPVQAEVRRRIGNFIVAEDDQTLESVLLAELRRTNATLALAETFTGGLIAGRLAPHAAADRIFLRAVISRDPAQLHAAVGLPTPHSPLDERTAKTVATAIRQQANATHALAVLIDLDEGTDRMDLGATVWISIATTNQTQSRRARILGGRDWIRLGAAELAMDCLRRTLHGLPIDQRTDFEKT